MTQAPQDPSQPEYGQQPYDAPVDQPTFGQPYEAPADEPTFNQPTYGSPIPGPQSYGTPPPGPQSYGTPPPGPQPFATEQPYGAQQPYASQQPYGAPTGTPYQMQPAYNAAGPVGGKSKLVAGLLGILLGGLGIHNFYLGNTTKGVIQLLITVLSVGFLSWVSAIWGLIEGIMILVSKPGEQWHRDAAGYELTD